MKGVGGGGRYISSQLPNSSLFLCTLPFQSPSCGVLTFQVDARDNAGQTAHHDGVSVKIPHSTYFYKEAVLDLCIRWVPDYKKGGGGVKMCRN